MQNPDQAVLLKLLGIALASLGKSFHDIEDRLGIGHGTLNRLLDGRMELKLRHLLDICRILDIHPRDVIEAGFPDWQAAHRLNDWMPVRLRKATPPIALSEEIQEAIRNAVREEIARAGLAPGKQPSRRSRA